jgi:hypothetical protein
VDIRNIMPGESRNAMRAYPNLVALRRVSRSRENP